MYGSSRDAHLGLGTVQVHRNPDGTVRITDVWDVDNPERRLPDGRIADLLKAAGKQPKFLILLPRSERIGRCLLTFS